jgi:CRP-like cAMP-binding protein
MIKANPEIAQAFIEELARRLIAADSRLVELTG